MQFVKTHWVSLLCGLAAAAGVTFAVLGMTGTTVEQELAKRAQQAGEIGSLRNDPQNEATIAAELERGRKFEQEYEELVRQTEEYNKREPLLEGAFPKPSQVETNYRFREAYTRALWELPRRVSAGTLPNEADLRDEAEVYAEILKRKAEQEGETASTKVEEPEPTDGGMPPGGYGGSMPPGGYGRGMVAPGGFGRGMVAPGGPAGRGSRMPPGMAPGMAPQAQGPSMPNVNMEEVRKRANVKKAQSIRVYASPQESLHISPIAMAPEPPEPREMWYAQVSLWIQEDLMEAIAAVNEAAARALGEAEVGVAKMPVKRIENIRVLGYVTSSGAMVEIPAAGAGASSAAQATAPGPSFTGRKSDERFDVVRVMLTVVMDQRDILQLIDAVTRENFYQLVGFEYTALESVDPAGYLYGDEPIVRAVFDFEGYMARKIFKAMMPAEVLVELGIQGGDKDGGKDN